MKKAVLSFGMMMFCAGLSAQQFIPTDNGSSVAFSIKNFGLNVTGNFQGLKGVIIFNPGNLQKSSMNVTVNTATINTGNGSRDGHLRKEEYLDVAQFPVISFSSTGISPSAKAGSYLMEGKITIKGITQKVSFPFTVTLKEGQYLFGGEFRLNRRDFKVGGKSMVMSDNLLVKLAVVARSNGK